jgi:hypothetical protein
MQSAANMAEAYPGLGSPLDIAERYELLPKQFFKELTGIERFIYDYKILVEHQRRQVETREKRKAEDDEHRKFPTMDRYKREEDFWAEVQSANEETATTEDQKE